MEGVEEEVADSCCYFDFEEKDCLNIDFDYCNLAAAAVVVAGKMDWNNSCCFHCWFEAVAD